MTRVALKEEKYDPLSALNIRRTKLTEQIIVDTIDSLEPIQEVEDQEMHDRWLFS